MITAIILVVFPFAMIYAAISDILTMTIANRVSLVLIGTFIVIAPFIGLTWSEFGMHLAAFGLVLAVTFCLFAAGMLGGGDAKLMASTALWMGMGAPLVSYIIISTVAGGILTIALMVVRGSPLAVVAGEVPALRRVLDEKDIPYGVALAIGGLMAFEASPAMVWAVNQLV